MVHPTFYSPSCQCHHMRSISIVVCTKKKHLHELDFYVLYCRYCTDRKCILYALRMYYVYCAAEKFSFVYTRKMFALRANQHYTVPFLPILNSGHDLTVHIIGLFMPADSVNFTVLHMILSRYLRLKVKIYVHT